MIAKNITEINKWIHEPLKNYSNRLYHQQSLLGQMNILSGKTAMDELTQAIMNNINNNHFVAAINILCRMASIKRFPDAFYDDFSYEKLSAQDIHNRLIKYFKKMTNTKILKHA